MFKNIMVSGLVAFVMPIFAQQEPGQWVGDLYLIKHYANPTQYVLLDGKNYVQSTIPHVSKAVDFPVQSKFLNGETWSYWQDDALYTLAYGYEPEKNQDGSLFRRWTLAKWQDDEWHFLANFNADSRALLKSIPCGNDRFIVVSSTIDLVDDNRPDRSPFARMSLNADKKELRLGSSIYHGQDELKQHMQAAPPNPQAPSREALLRLATTPNCFGLAYSSDIVMTEGHATLVNKKTGLFWVFSLEKASLVKAGNIFKKMTPEMVAKGGFSDAILTLNPEKDGTVLIAAQDEGFFTTETGDALKEANEAQNLSLEDRLAMFSRRLHELAQQNPHIFWYRIYPNTGKVEKLTYPPEGGSLDRNGGKNDHWRPLPDGSVKMGSIKLNEQTKPVQKDETQNGPAQAVDTPPKTDSGANKAGTVAK